MSQHFDVVVLGAGPGGYVAAIRAAQLGKSVAVVENKYWGGVCLNVGCIPSKALLRNAELAHLLEHEKDTFGITGDAAMDYKPTHARSRKVSEKIVKGVHFLMKKNKITEVNGWGTLTGEKSMEVKTSDGDTEELTYDNLILATGATTKVIPGTELSERVVTYEEQILDEQLPGSIVIAGSGAIGVEFAYVMVNFGVDVTIVEFLDRMVPTEDAEVSKELLRQYKKLGVKVLLSTKVESIDDSGDKVKVTVSKDGKEQTIETDKVLQATGFAPRVEGFGLDAAGVKVTDRGAIDIDEYGRTNVDGIYAIGDCTGKLDARPHGRGAGCGRRRDARRCGHDAGRRSTSSRARRSASRRWPRSATRRSRPRRRGTTSRPPSSRSPPTARPWASATASASSRWSRTRTHNEIIGAHMIGPDVTELLPVLTLAQRWDLTADEVARNVFAHPTLSEAVKETVEGIAGHMINL